MNHPRPNGQQMSELGYSNQVSLTLTRTVVFLFFSPGNISRRLHGNTGTWGSLWKMSELYKTDAQMLLPMVERSWSLGLATSGSYPWPTICQLSNWVQFYLAPPETQFPQLYATNQTNCAEFPWIMRYTWYIFFYCLAYRCSTNVSYFY